LITYH